MKEKFCKDCELCYVRTTQFSDGMFCERNKDPVTGETDISTDNMCKFQRRGGWLFAVLNDLCGKSGRFFEPKTDVKKLIRELKEDGE